MKTYVGIRNNVGCHVFLFEENDKQPVDLNPRLDIMDHSPTGFEWGYSGSGPAQLALALLADNFEPNVVLTHYQDFKSSVVANLDKKTWEMTEEFIVNWVNSKRFSHGC